MREHVFELVHTLMEEKISQPQLHWA